MNLQISIVLLFIFLTGGCSLKCYTCTSAQAGCEGNVQTCGDRFSKCESQTLKQPFVLTTLTIKTKSCAAVCVAGSEQLPTGGTVTTHCCDTDLCNAADGVYKGSFLLLLSPLLFYFLFQ